MNIKNIRKSRIVGDSKLNYSSFGCRHSSPEYGIENDWPKFQCLDVARIDDRKCHKFPVFDLAKTPNY
jgi:hypothetical protein